MPPPRSGMARPASGVLPVVDRPRWCGSARAEARDPLGAELLDVRRSPVQAVDPVAEPGLDRVLVASDRVPFEIEAVVPVVRSLDVRRVGTEGLHDDRIDDETRQD